MTDSSETPNEPRQRPQNEYEDPHFHDDDEVVPVDDVEPRSPRVPSRRKAVRRPPPRRPHYED
jgi:hypothetical protein